MNIGLIDVDGHHFPNVALMKIASYYRERGHNVEWALPIFGRYTKIYASKIFTFSDEFNRLEYNAGEFICGGTGYDIKSKLPEEIDAHTGLAYDLYNCRFSVQFYSRGCIRKCPFCLVREKEGYITTVKPLEWNPNAKWIEVLDNNFFANPQWRKAIDNLRQQRIPVKFHGVDIRIMNKEQAETIGSLKLKNGVHVAWDLPNLDLTAQLEMANKYLKNKLVCYVLIGYNTTPDYDLYRLRTLKKLDILPFVQPYRDYYNKKIPSQYERDLARWANRPWLFKTMDFTDYRPRKGFQCSEYFY